MAPEPPGTSSGLEMSIRQKFQTFSASCKSFGTHGRFRGCPKLHNPTFSHTRQQEAKPLLEKVVACDKEYKALMKTSKAYIFISFLVSCTPQICPAYGPRARA